MDDEENEIYEDADEEIEDQRNYPDLELGDIGAGGDTGNILFIKLVFIKIFTFINHLMHNIFIRSG